MLNNVALMGRLTADPILRYTTTSQRPVASFSIAVDRRYAKDKEVPTDFFNIVAWNATAEFLARNFTKGQPVCVEGRLQQRSFIDEATKATRFVVEVIAESVHFAGFKKEEGQSAGANVTDFDPYAGNALPVAA